MSVSTLFAIDSQSSSTKTMPSRALHTEQENQQTTNTNHIHPSTNRYI